MGEDDNWWAAGPIGSCGPCSEIYYDTGNKEGCTSGDACAPGCDCDRFLEIWNLVFTEWNRLEDGTLVPLPEKNIDTGAGLERITSVIQNKKTNFDTDIFLPITSHIVSLLELPNVENTSVKIIADHVRAATFLIGDGVLPSNEGRGYILRKLIRRALGVGSIEKNQLLEKEDVFLYKLVSTVINAMKEGYPDLVEKQEYIEKVIKLEEERFTVTLKHGTEILQNEIKTLKSKGETKLSADISFKLYDTYGFPFEFTKKILEDAVIEVVEEEFNKKLEEQVLRSQSSKENISDMIKDDFIDDFFAKHGKTDFVGYEELKSKGKVLHIAKINGLESYEVIFDKTPFYAESGGQVADKGTIKFHSFEANIIDVVKKKDIFIHQIEIVRGQMPDIGDEVELFVDVENRMNTQRNHTATHLLHEALRQVLGTHVEQSGSLVDGERLRFDFSHYEAISKDDLKKIENMVNQVILNNYLVDVSYEDIQNAKSRGAKALFSDKYGSVVRVVEIPGFSIELCGGTHAKSTGEIGLFNIESESGIASGVRRITATTGNRSLSYVRELEEKLDILASLVKSDTTNVVEALKKSIEENKEKSKAFDQLQTKLIKYEIVDLLSEVKDINGVKVLIKSYENKEIETLKEIVDRAKEHLGSTIILLGSNNEKAIFASGVTKNLISNIKAGDIVKKAAEVADGNGGGRPDFAQAGGKNGAKVNDALLVAEEYISNCLNGTAK